MEFNSSSYSEAFKKFADWVDAIETKLNTMCHCCPQETNSSTNQTKQNNNHSSNNRESILITDNTTTTSATLSPTTTTITTNSATKCPTPSLTIKEGNSINGIQNRSHNWKNVIKHHQKLQNEVEEFGKQLNCELKRFLNEDKSCSKEQFDEAAVLEERWFKLWLKSLEQLVVVERTRRCPKHNSTLIGKPSCPPTKRGTPRLSRVRPISYPNNQTERLEWDYDFTLSLTGCHKENGSQIDLDSVDEQVTKNLTEFGENYELWLPEHEIGCMTMHSRPASVEPAEKPETGKAVETSVLNHRHEDDDDDCKPLKLIEPSPMISVNAKYSPKKKQGTWRFILIILFIIIFIFALHQEPHHMHKSYYHAQPPV